MMLFNLMVRLLAAVALAGLWVGPAVCMDNVSQTINSPDTEPAATSATDKISVENPVQEALSNSAVSSKILPRSAIDTKELMKIFKIAYTYNDSRVLSQPLNYHELPGGESLKRGLRSVKNDNVALRMQGKDFSPAQLVTDITQNDEKDKTITYIPLNVKCVHANDNVFSEFVFEVGEVTRAMVNTINFFASALEKKLETLGEKVLEFGNSTLFDIVIFLIIVACISVAIILLICYRILLTLPQKPVPSECEERKSCNTLKKHLKITLDYDNTISYMDIHANEVKLNNGNNKYVYSCVYLTPGASIN